MRMFMNSPRRRRGAAMMEMVMVLPLIAVVLALLFYLGRMETRTQRTLTTSRYESWRAAAGAPGPSAQDLNGEDAEYEQTLALNRLSFNAAASELHVYGGSDGWFQGGLSLQAFEEFVDGVGQESDSAGSLAEAYAWQPGSVGYETRLSNGLRRVVTTKHEDSVGDWLSLSNVWRNEEVDPVEQNPGNTAISRRTYRTGTDWAYTEDWRASPHRWQIAGGRGSIDTLRAIRDTYYADFDASLDGVDGETSYEYPSTNVQVPGANLAGRVRKIYLSTAPYRGPDLDNSRNSSQYSYGG